MGIILVVIWWALLVARSMAEMLQLSLKITQSLLTRMQLHLIHLRPWRQMCKQMSAPAWAWTPRVMGRTRLQVAKANRHPARPPLVSTDLQHWHRIQCCQLLL